MPKKYDYIIAGAGLAGLSLAYKIRKDASLNDKRILLVDKDHKNKNDRTWCFWSKAPGDFDHIRYKVWPKIFFANEDFQRSFEIAPYSYNMIRGIDFYNHAHAFLKECPNTTFEIADIQGCSDHGDYARLKTRSTEYQADYIFKSYYEKIDFSASNFVWQHFKGWIINTAEDSFNDEEAIFMDFRVEQGEDTRFLYVLPVNTKKALVEIAVFSEEIPDPSFYDPFLKAYISDTLKIGQYDIEEEELGAIPMTDYKFDNQLPSRIINLGTNGGRVKASSGYAFTRIQAENNRLFEFLKKDQLDRYRYRSTRYDFYDSIMLNAILTGKTSGKEVFSKLFSKLAPQTIFKFLDEEGSFFNDLVVFTAPPTLPFFKAFLEELRK